MLPRTMRRASALVAVLAGGLGLAGASAAAASSPRQIRIGRAARLPATAQITGTTPTSTEIPMTIALAPQDPSVLAALATAVSTPGSPEFRQYLTVDQFARRFGATPAAIAAVQSALRAAGLEVGAVSADGLTIPVEGTAGQVQRAFSVSMARVALRGGASAYANQQAPSLPAGIAVYVQGVIGLDDLTPQRPAGLSRLRLGKSPAGTSGTGVRVSGTGVGASKAGVRVSSAGQSRMRFLHEVSSRQAAQAVTGGPQPCATATQHVTLGQQAGMSPYTADQLASAYRLSTLYRAGDLGQGQTVALIEEEPYDPTDVADYQACYGTNASVTNVDVDGGPGPYVSGRSDDGEAALDIEVVTGLAPKASVLVYEGPASTASPVDILSAIVSQDAAKVISSSWGACESDTDPAVIAAENTLLEEAATQGQSFFASSGDSGAEMCSQLGTGVFSLSVEDPAAQPYATGVGGTTLSVLGPPANETIWNDGPNPACNCTPDANGGATGGGVSAQWPMPAYQAGAPSSLDVVGGASSGAPCRAGSECREVPDVSADASDYTGYITRANGDWGISGGTSASTPLWASLAALANASATCRGVSIGFVNPSLYEIAAGSYASNFNDVTAASRVSGASTNDTLEQFGIADSDPGNLYPVGTGYDMATGLGTPIGDALASSLCSMRAPAYSVTVTDPGAQRSVVGHGVSLQVRGSDSGGSHLSYSASGLPSGLSIDTSTGMVSGVPSAAGAFTVTVAAQDGFVNSAATSFPWTVIKPGPPRLSGASLSGVRKRRAKLRLTIDAGLNASAVGSVTVSLPAGLSFAHLERKKLHASIKSDVALTPRVSANKLTITFAHAVTSATVTINPTLLKVGAGLAAQARRHKVKRVIVGVKAVDAGGVDTALSMRLAV